METSLFCKLVMAMMMVMKVMIRTMKVMKMMMGMVMSFPQPSGCSIADTAGRYERATLFHDGLAKAGCPT